MKRPLFDLTASGMRMKALRKQRKISVKQVMEYMGFESTQAVYKWEAGKCFPQADNLIALAMLYNVSPSELLVAETEEVSSFFAQKKGNINMWKLLSSYCIIVNKNNRDFLLF